MPMMNNMHSLLSAAAQVLPQKLSTTDKSKVTIEEIAEGVTKELVAQFLSKIGLKQYSQLFMENNVHGSLLITLDTDDLKDLGLSNGFHRRKIISEFARYLKDKQ